MPGKITAVMEQAGELDFLVNVAEEHKWRGLSPVRQPRGRG